MTDPGIGPGVPPVAWPAGRPPPPSARELVRAVALLILTTASCWWTYGTFWSGGDVFADPQLARDALQYALALMGILLAHEMGHWVVARRHGLDQSLPQFLPFPVAFGTLGAIIRLRSLPRTRTALLEVGAAGPLAGFVVAAAVMAVGLPGTEEFSAPVLTLDWPLQRPSEPGAGMALVLAGLEAFAGIVDWVVRTFGIAPPGGDDPAAIPLLVLANPLLMDFLGQLVLGSPPGRYADIPPLVLASWAGCFVTAMNLLPIGQLDGGHVFNALAPGRARAVSLMGLGLLALAGLLSWGGWIFWALLLGVLGAWRSLPVPAEPAPTG
ncbi:MAG: site-2 protease family protein, partial [Myxococcota bacterium]|nr:site-2 protease family protein [Myxococcota bacterium]